MRNADEAGWRQIVVRQQEVEAAGPSDAAPPNLESAVPLHEQHACRDRASVAPAPAASPPKPFVLDRKVQQTVARLTAPKTTTEDGQRGGKLRQAVSSVAREQMVRKTAAAISKDNTRHIA